MGADVCPNDRGKKGVWGQSSAGASTILAANLIGPLALNVSFRLCCDPASRLGSALPDVACGGGGGLGGRSQICSRSCPNTAPVLAVPSAAFHQWRCPVATLV